MPKCNRCKNSFKMPKGRTVCYLCEDCRNEAVYNPPVELEIESYLGQIGEDDDIQV